MSNLIESPLNADSLKLMTERRTAAKPAKARVVDDEDVDIGLEEETIRVKKRCERVIALVESCLRERESAGTIAQHLVDQAARAGSTDNASCCVLLLRP